MIKKKEIPKNWDISKVRKYKSRKRKGKYATKTDIEVMLG